MASIVEKLQPFMLAEAKEMLGDLFVSGECSGYFLCGDNVVVDDLDMAALVKAAKMAWEVRGSRKTDGVYVYVAHGRLAATVGPRPVRPKRKANK